MKIRVSSNGHVVLPTSIRRTLGLRAGDTLDVSLRDGQVILAPSQPTLFKGTIRRDPITKLPVLSAGSAAPRLTSEQVEDILAKFP